MWTPIALEVPTLRTRTVLTPWFSYTSNISALLSAHRQLTPIVPLNDRRQVLQVPRNAFHFSVPLYLQRFQRHHANVALELRDRVLHTPVAAILCLNLIPLLMINNQPTIDHSMDSFDPDSSSHIVPFGFLVNLRGTCFIQHRPAASPSLLRPSIPTAAQETNQCFFNSPLTLTPCGVPKFQ